MCRALALAAALLLAGAASAAAAPAWLLPDTPISATGLTPTADPPQVAGDATGDFVAAWIVNDGTNAVVQASVRYAGGGNAFVPAVQLSPDGADAAGVRVAMDAKGDAIAVWSSSDKSVYYSFMPARGSFSPQQAIAGGLAATVPDVALDANGDAIAVWQQSDGTDQRIYEALRPAGGAFGAATPISTAGDNSSAPQIAMDPAGDAAAVWLTSIGGFEVAQGDSRVAGGAFGVTPVNLSKAGHTAATPQVAMDAQGDATAVWSFTNVTSDIQYSDQPAKGSFSAAPGNIQTANSQTVPVVAMDPAGDTAVAWQEGANPAGAALRASGQNTFALQTLQKMVKQLSVAFDAQGDAIVVGVDANANGQAQVAPAPLGTFGVPQQISFAGEGAIDPAVATDPAGDAAAVWVGMQPTSRIRAAGYDGAPPVLSGFTVPATAYAGAQAPMSVLELDVWSQIASTTWSFGDGTSGAGLSVSHAYASPGLYTVSATAADAVGNAVTTPPARIDVLPAPPPPPLPAPVLARAANVYLVTGTVLVRVPGSHTFAPLQLGEQIPVGSLIDATHGTVTVTVALPNGTTQSANFYDGEFEFEQARSGTTTAVLAGGTFKGCPAVKHAAFAARRRNSTVRSLWADGHGSFQTRGRYASGAVSGTQWFTQDRCDGTYIKVTRDVVLVSSLVGRHDKRKIRQGHSILVGARGF